MEDQQPDRVVGMDEIVEFMMKHKPIERLRREKVDELLIENGKIIEKYNKEQKVRLIKDSVINRQYKHLSKLESNILRIYKSHPQLLSNCMLMDHTSMKKFIATCQYNTTPPLAPAATNHNASHATGGTEQ